MDQRLRFATWECRTDLLPFQNRQERLRERFLSVTRNLMCGTVEITNFSDVVRMVKTARICQWTEGKTKDSADHTLKAINKYPEIEKNPGFVYVLRAGPYYKIGKTIKPSSRIKTISLQMPFAIEIDAIIPALSYTKLEKLMHDLFRSKRANGEWFLLDDADVELFYEFESIYTLPPHVDRLLSGEYKHIMGDMQRIIQDDR